MTLRIGSKGEDVEALQTWLAGQGLLVLVDGSFGKATEQAVKDMQIRCQVYADGVVGDGTRIAFARAGWVTVPASKLPPAPDFFPLNFAGRQRVFGEIRCEALANRSDVRITNDWQHVNLTRVIVPQLVGVDGAPKDGGIFWHKMGVEQLLAFWAEVESAGLLDRVLSWSGSWVPRYIRGSTTTLSAHAHATAFDVNVPWNQLGAAPAKLGSKGSVVELVPIANRHGFYWGGHFATRADGQHFELVRADA